MNIKFALLTIFCFFLLFSCAERRVYLPDGKDRGEILKKEDKIQTEEAKPDDKADKVDKDDEFISSEIREIIKKLQKDIGDIHFDYDKYDIRQNDIPTLKKVASALQKYPKLRVIIEGHCDERGTNEYNFALGQKRANSAKQYLITLGVSSARIDIISYGEEKPLCSEQNEACWQKNRRAHFVFIEEGK
ncbi:MAG: peptidoglycan-associated lipoprotein Pal [Thermodesulfovibrio sp.]|nr:peptidoglycan-associated lipoprotein Pal [Thermodesulfovibrio sp.]